MKKSGEKKNQNVKTKTNFQLSPNYVIKVPHKNNGDLAQLKKKKKKKVYRKNFEF